MSKYLRDQRLRNLNLNEERLRRIDSLLKAVVDSVNSIPDVQANQPRIVRLGYLIRFDNKGFILDDIEEVLTYLRGSKVCERICFAVDSDESRANRANGKSIDLILDAKDKNNCTLTVRDDNKEWVDLWFSSIIEELGLHKNRSRYINNMWTPIIVQLFGVLLSFVFSLMVAYDISPHLSVDYAFVVTFLCAFIVFSNIWGFIYNQILTGLEGLFPNIRFKDNNLVDTAKQSLLISVVATFGLFIANKLLELIGTLFGLVLRH
jgi:hypothetical protein